jgi:signal transduction histidine kinase
MMRREIKRESRRRKDEHLAFSGMLANGIVHDFRNPMSSMKLDVQMLHREANKNLSDTNRISTLANRIRNTVDRMDKVFQEFLYVSRPDQDKSTSVNLISCIEDSLDMLTSRFENAGISSKLNCTESNISARAYEGSLRRALVNILTNAIQFSPANSTVTVNLYTTTNTSVIEVSDQGPGIPKSKRKTVFEMFETERPEGTGLGLFIAKAAIERNNGIIEICANDNNIGTLVRVRLPLNSKSQTLAQ